MNGFKKFFKLFIGLLCWVCVAIATIGAITSADVVFQICGIVSAATLAVYAYRFINTHSGGYVDEE